VPPADADSWLRLVVASVGRAAGITCDDAAYVPPDHLLRSGATLRCDDVAYLPPVQVVVLRLLDATCACDDVAYFPPVHLLGSGATLRCDDVAYLPPVQVAGVLRLVDASCGSGATVSSEDALWVVAANGMDWSPLASPEPSVSSSSCTTASRALSGSSSVALSIAIRSWNNSAGEY
jgi:hypothetical protein